MTNSKYDIQHFLHAQEKDYEIALREIKIGKKQTHWMWYIFPQLEGLGFSEMSKRYAITGLDEVREFLQHPVLGTMLMAICYELLNAHTNDAVEIFGRPDNMKLRSSMTLFSLIKESDEVFQQVLQKYFKGETDPKTLEMLFNNK